MVFKKMKKFIEIDKVEVTRRKNSSHGSEIYSIIFKFNKFYKQTNGTTAATEN